MALLKKRFGANLSDNARMALEGCRAYLPSSSLQNPLMRRLGRRIVEADWLATLATIDFPYTLEDEQLGGVNCVKYRAGPPSLPHRILYIHGGGFISGSPRVNASIALPACRLANVDAVGVEYTLAPDGRFPTQLEEIERVYLALIESGTAPHDIVVMGESAGGTLALASLHRWRRLDLPMPAGAVLLSPVADATASSDTFHALYGRDPIFSIFGRASIPGVFALYAPGVDLENPEVSPLYGDFAGLPPLLIQVGAREVLLGDAARVAEKARRAGVDAHLRVHDGMFHLFHMHWALEETRAAYDDIADFIRRVTDARRSSPAAERNFAASH